MNPRGRHVEDVTTEGGFGPSWSPNGRWIAFFDDGDVFKIRPDGTRLTQLTSTSIEESWPCWSPNGRRIVYLRTRSNDERSFYLAAIWVMRSDRTGAHRVLRRVSGGQLPLEMPDWQTREP
jgi:Tol biopolymer transport system component